MDPAKLKVVELRAELQARGLDTKGNKPVLVKRLKEALEAELHTELPDTSIADTSTEDLSQPEDDNCMVEEARSAAEPLQPSSAELEHSNTVPVVDTLVDVPTEQSSPVVESIAPTPDVHAQSTEPPEAIAADVAEKVIEADDSKPDEPVDAAPMAIGDESVETQSEESKDPNAENAHETKHEETIPECNVDQNGGNTNGDVEEEVCEPKAKKSRWTEDAVTTDAVAADTAAPLHALAESKESTDELRTGEKRKHSSPPPDEKRAQQQQPRDKSPVREDEPASDANKVQLSWYDSDLHLQIDKTNFLSARPLTDGLFGYIWSGARLTHGVKAGKACFEVKIVEELKFDDVLNERRDSNNRRDRREHKERDRSRTQSENGQQEKKEDTLAVVEVVEEEKRPELDCTADITTEQEEEKEEAAISVDEKSQCEPTVTEAPEERADEKQEEKIEADEQAEVKEGVPPEIQEDKSSQAIESAVSTEESKGDDKTTEEETKELLKIPTHVIRIGWSAPNTSLQLGEEPFSFGLDSNGKFYTNKTAVEAPSAIFKVGDVVKAYADLDARELAFAVNGVLVFVYQIPAGADDPEGLALFPHVLTRNLTFEINAGDGDQAFGDVDPEGYEAYAFVAALDERIAGARCAERREDCEVIMMCGLPGSGKTHWVREYVKAAPPEKCYNIIGSSFLVERMTVGGQPIDASIPPERRSFFWNRLGKSINKLCDLAPLRRRDFILDQTNLNPSAIRRKMRSFAGFKRHAVIVVNDDEEQERRAKQQEPETGKEMSASALHDMKANMGLPKIGEHVEKVTYASLPEEKAIEQMQKYKKQGRDALTSSHNRRDYRDDRSMRWYQGGAGGGSRGSSSGGTGSGGGGGPRRDFHHRNNYRDRPYPPNNRFDQQRSYRQGGGGGGHGGAPWRASGGGPGNWNGRNDNRRDNRGGGGGGGGGGGHRSDWHGNSRNMNDRPQHRGGGGGVRDHRSQSHLANNTGGSYNRNRSQSGGGGGGRWGGSGGGVWSSHGGSGSGWNGSGGGQGGQDWHTSSGGGGGGGWNHQSQGSWNQNQWKYGGGYNQGGYSQYPQNWNSSYYGGGSAAGGGGSYTQDWSGGSGQSATTAPPSASNSSSASASQYASSSPMMSSGAHQQQAQHQQWSAPYSQQSYTTSGGTTSGGASK